MTELCIRAAVPSDAPFLWRMLTFAASMEGTPADVAHAQTEPTLKHYVEGFGRRGDVGVVAVHGDVPQGAAWVRLAPPGHPASPSKVWTDTIPELAIATVPEMRGTGLGRRLLEALFDAASAEHACIALSVRDGNPAVRLYERTGFSIDRRIVNRVGTTSLVMSRPLRP